MLLIKIISNLLLVHLIFLSIYILSENPIYIFNITYLHQKFEPLEIQSNTKKSMSHNFIYNDSMLPFKKKLPLQNQILEPQLLIHS